MITAQDSRIVGTTRFMRPAYAIVTVAILGLFASAASCAGQGSVVDRLTVVNRTPFDVHVDVTDASRESWLILGIARHESSTVKEQVTDMGDVWVIRFHHAGRTVGELTLDREELIREEWRVVVPSAVEDRMRDLGFEPPPDS